MTRLTVLDTRSEHPEHAVIVDRVHPDETARSRFRRRSGFAANAFAWSADTVCPNGGPSFVLREHIGWLAPDDVSPADAPDVVKQISFLHKSDAFDIDQFRVSYRHHVHVARRHMHTLWQYVQYDVVRVEGARAELADGIVAVSVLWFRSTDDFCNRYFASPEDQAQFQSEEGFLDLSKAFSFVLTSLPSAGPADRPADV